MTKDTKRPRRIKTDPAEVWAEYEKALMYNDAIDLPNRVKNNNNFFIGKQWEGVKAPDVDKPVFNVFKRVINYFISMLVSDNIGVSLSLINRVETDIERVQFGIIKDQIAQSMEINKFSRISRDVLKNAAIDGDGCVHVYFDPDIETGREGEEGLIKIEEIDNLNVFFGNPNIHEVQDQPYIIISRRRLVGEVRDELIDQGREGDAWAVKSDHPQDEEYSQEHYYDDKVTVLRKYWKEKGRVHFLECTKDVTIFEDTDSDLKLYPISWMNWERVKNCYHGFGAVEGLIPNQIAINKLAAMANEFIKQQAFSRVFYDETKLSRWVGGIKPLGVQGNPRDIVFTDPHRTDMSSQVSEYFVRFMENTKELMGASDASLGNISNPDNTSAIIATQKATSVPLELIKQEYYQFVEDFVRIVIDQMRARYGKRTVVGKDDNGDSQEVEFDFSILEGWVISLNVDIGQAAYWNEMTGIDTLSNLLEAQLVDPVTFLESIPATHLPYKERIVKEFKEKMNAEKAAPAVPEQTAPALEMM
ncbi:MAG: hypothetical protein IJD14_04865 [Christensenellaceae bacterium]|nr:hypothetical protein [Christensenellaceae bacterium]